MDIDPIIFEMIKSLKDYINNGDFTGFYQKLNYKLLGQNRFLLIEEDIGTVTQMFYEVGSLDEVLSDMYYIPEYMFYGTNIPKIVLPPNIKTIGSRAFKHCQAEEIVLPDTLNAIGSGAFAYCRSLKEIKIPKSVNSLSTDGTFWKCDKVIRFWIPEKFKGKIKKEELCGREVIGRIKYY